MYYQIYVKSQLKMHDSCVCFITIQLKQILCSTNYIININICLCVEIIVDDYETLSMIINHVIWRNY